MHRKLLAEKIRIASNQQQQQRKTFKTCCFEFCRSTTLKATACAACDSPAWKSRLGSGECKKERSILKQTFILWEKPWFVPKLLNQVWITCIAGPAKPSSNDMMSTFAGMSGLESSSASLLLVYKSVLVCKQVFVEIVGTKLIAVEILQRQPAVKVGLTKLR